jgi:hypothetical protein
MLARHAVCFVLVALFTSLVSAEEMTPLKIGEPVGGHIHPSVCRTVKGTLVVTFGRVNHRDLRILRSTDQGRTWSTPEPFVHTVNKSYYPGSLTALADGRIVHSWNRWSEETNELEPRRVLYSTSADEGLTWSEPVALPFDPTKRSVIRHPIVELSSTRWLFPLDDATLIFNPIDKSSTLFGDGRLHGLVPVVRTPRGTFVSGAGLRSTDEGKSWQPIAKFPDIKTQGWRHELVCLSNGTLLASEILGPGVGGERIRYRISTDDGLTWEKHFEYYNPGRPIGGRACPRTVELDGESIGVVFYDVATQPAPSLFFMRIPLDKLR